MIEYFSKTLIILISSLFIITFSNSNELDCNKFEKMSAKYLECNTKKLKEKTIKKVEIGKEKIDTLSIKKKVNKFKNSKTLSDLIKK